MKSVFVSIAMLALIASQTAQADLTEVLELYNKHHYQSAAKILRQQMVSSSTQATDQALLTLGMIFLKNSELYDAFYKASIKSNYDYLHYLVSERVKSPSIYVNLYLAKALIETGELSSAKKYLLAFIDKGEAPAKYKKIAKINLALCLYLENKGQQAIKIWKTIRTRDMDVRAELVAAYKKSGFKDVDILKMADEIKSDLVKYREKATASAYYNLIDIYAYEGDINTTLALIEAVDLSLPVYKETISESKKLQFYHLPLTKSLSYLFRRASEYYLKKVNGKRHNDTASYYLGEVYFLSGDTQSEAKSTRKALASYRLSEDLATRARIRQAAGLYASGQKWVAMQVWNELADSDRVRPDQLADALTFCGYVNADCRKILNTAIKLSGEYVEKNTKNLNFAIGQYYLTQVNYEKSITYLEAARDKSKKNKIEANNPMLLVGLAEAYRGNKHYSENLEIFFEMSEEFPAARQIQEAVQGIYSLEHRSAGDVKIL